MVFISTKGRLWPFRVILHSSDQTSAVLIFDSLFSHSFFNLLLFFKVFLCLFSPSPGTFPFIYYSTQSRIVFVWGRDRIGRNKYQANVIDIHSYIEEIEHTAR